MKYLHDNGFKVLTVNDLGYDTKNNFLYIKPSVAQLAVANPVSQTKFYSINVTGTNRVTLKQSSAITQNNTALSTLSSRSSSYLFHPMPRISHLSVPINSKSYASSGSHPNDKSSKHNSYASYKHHGGYCTYTDYKSNVKSCA